MGNAILRIGHPGGQKIAGVALPVEAHHHFRIKIHPLAERHAVYQLQRGRDRIDAKAAHAVFKLQRQGFDPYPDMGDPAAIPARAGDGVVVNRLAGDQRLGVAFCQRQQLRNILNRMLSIGIHLHRMGISRPGAHFQPADHRRAFTGVVRQPHQGDMGIVSSQLVQRLPGTGVAAIVDHNNRQLKRCQARQHVRHHCPVVVAGDQDAGAEG